MKSHITRTVLLDMLHAGAELKMEKQDDAIAFVPDSPVWDKYYPSSIVRIVKRLLKRGMIVLKDAVELTDRGRMQIGTFDFSGLSIPRVRWDGKWRLVFFDIPAPLASVRFKLLETLRALGFYRLQNSLYVHPYPCDRQIGYIRETLGLKDSLRLAVIERIEGDDELRKRFGV